MHSQSRFHKILLVWDLKNPTQPHSPHHLSDAWTNHLWYHHSTSELQVSSKLPCIPLHTTKLSEIGHSNGKKDLENTIVPSYNSCWQKYLFCLLGR